MDNEVSCQQSGQSKRATPALYPGGPGTMYLTAPGSAVHCTGAAPVQCTLTAPGSKVHCTRSAPVQCTLTARAVRVHCTRTAPQADQSEARKSMATNHGPPWGAVQCTPTTPGSAGTLYRGRPGTIYRDRPGTMYRTADMIKD